MPRHRLPRGLSVSDGQGDPIIVYQSSAERVRATVLFGYTYRTLIPITTDFHIPLYCYVNYIPPYGVGNRASRSISRMHDSVRAVPRGFTREYHTVRIELDLLLSLMIIGGVLITRLYLLGSSASIYNRSMTGSCLGIEQALSFFLFSLSISTLSHTKFRNLF